MEKEHLHGATYSASIKGVYIYGHISVHDGKCYLCQDFFNGARCPERFGHKYSWHVGSLDKYDLAYNSVSNFQFTNDEIPFVKTKFNVENIVRIKGKSRDYKVFVVKDKEYWLKALNKKNIIGPIHEDQLELSNTQYKSTSLDSFIISEVTL